VSEKILIVNDSRTKDIPIIFLSAKNDKSDKITGLELGAEDYITKPFDYGEVFVRVNNQLKIRRLTQSLMAANRALLERQHLLNEDLKAASLIQKTLIPRSPPDVKHFKFAWQFVPCEQIGGDIFNIHRLDNTYLSLYILDVSGHGIPSAMITVSVSQALMPHTGFILEEDKEQPDRMKITSPVDVLTKLDQEYPFERFDKYFTISYLVLNTETGVVQYSSAAHPPPVLLKADGGIEQLEAGGTVIGMGSIGAEDSVIPFEDGQVSMAHGDRLVLYTDGIVEHMDETGRFFGKKRLFHELEKHSTEPLDEVCRHVMSAVSDYGGTETPRDDMTILAIEYIGIDE